MTGLQGTPRVTDQANAIVIDPVFSRACVHTYVSAWACLFVERVRTRRRIVTWLNANVRAALDAWTGRVFPPK